MTSSSREVTGPANLSPAVRRKADLYFLAAAASGIGLQALAQPAHAEIVYTPADTVIEIGTHHYLDLNHDGINDFSFENYPNRGLGSTTFLIVSAVNSGAGIRERFKYALPLPPGARISPAEIFSMNATMARAYQGSSKGTWGKNRYLGLKFKISGGTHYGWAEFSVGLNNSGTIAAKLQGYAYETVANKPIIAGKTEESDAPIAQTARSVKAVRATIPVLALGHSGLSIWRREELGRAQ